MLSGLKVSKSDCTFKEYRIDLLYIHLYIYLLVDIVEMGMIVICKEEKGIFVVVKIEERLKSQNLTK